MPFVKLDTNILNSTLWFERVCREIFITALLMAEPREFTEELAQIEVGSLSETGWKVPPGWYGFVPAAGIGIIRRAMMDDDVAGLKALEQLGSPEDASRTKEFEGRRLVRVDGGYIVLNYFKYRDRDYTAAARSKKYRDRKRHGVTALRHGVTERNITQAEAEAYAEAIYLLYPRKVGKPDALKKIASAVREFGVDHISEKTKAYAEAVKDSEQQFIPHPATWYNQHRFNDDSSTWNAKKVAAKKSQPSFRTV